MRYRPERRTPLSYARLVSRNDVILTIVAAVLVGFSLVVSIVIPRRRPDFPGRSLRVFLIVTALLIVAMLTAVATLGEAHHFGAEGGEPGETTTAPTETTTAPTETTTAPSTGSTTQAAEGDPAAGKEVFATSAQPPCASCHTLQEAGASATVGPNLDEVLKGKDAAFIHESIIDPDAEIATGYAAGIMPKTYPQQLDEQQLADLVAFLEQAVNG
jgi:mono/diheme cytochrome c family protein